LCLIHVANCRKEQIVNTPSIVNRQSSIVNRQSLKYVDTMRLLVLILGLLSFFCTGTTLDAQVFEGTGGHAADDPSIYAMNDKLLEIISEQGLVFILFSLIPVGRGVIFRLNLKIHCNLRGQRMGIPILRVSRFLLMPFLPQM